MLTVLSVLSGGADASIAMWDLEAAVDDTKDGRGTVTHSPVASVTKYVKFCIAHCIVLRRSLKVDLV